MTVKHVRFAREGIAYPPPPNHSPSSSISSLPSSKGPSTPPSPFSKAAHLVQPVKGLPRLHPLLVISKPRAVNYDLTQHYTRISTSYASLSARHGLLSEPAVSPPVSHMTISCPYLPWRVNVRATLNGAYVTVQDVLRSIYYSLRTNVSSAEFHALPSKKEMQRVSAAYDERCRHSAEVVKEKASGVRRVDYLMGRTSFAGLHPSGDSWIMHAS